MRRNIDSNSTGQIHNGGASRSLNNNSSGSLGNHGLENDNDGVSVGHELGNGGVTSGCAFTLRPNIAPVASP